MGAAVTGSRMRAPTGEFLVGHRRLLGPIVAVQEDLDFCAAIEAGRPGVHQGVEVLSLDAPTRNSERRDWYEAKNEVDLKIDFVLPNGLSGESVVFCRQTRLTLIRAAGEVFDCVIFLKRGFWEAGKDGRPYVVGVAVRQSHYDTIRDHRIGVRVDFLTGDITLHGEFDPMLFQGGRPSTRHVSSPQAVLPIT